MAATRRANAMPRRLRPAGFDELGLRRARSDRMLPFLVGAMAFLAALALGGWVAAAGLAEHWRLGAAAAMTVQVPRPLEPAGQNPAGQNPAGQNPAGQSPAGQTSAGADSASALAGNGGGDGGGGGEGGANTRVARVVRLLNETPGIAEARALSADQLAELLRPWLGSGIDRLSIPMPAVIQVHLSADGPDLDALDRRLAALAPGTLMETHGVWIGRLAALARSLQACAGAALLVVAAVAVSVIAVATRAGLAARREAIEIVHGLGATDGYIASRFAARATVLAAAGALAGALAALPVLVGLARLSAPFAAATPGDGAALNALAVLPSGLWLALPTLPLAAAAIGLLTAQATVRRWLRRLP